MSMGSSGYYIDNQQAVAARAGAPRTALYYRSAEQARLNNARADNSHRATWIDPRSGVVWSLWDEHMPFSTVEHLRTIAVRMGTTLDDLLAQAGYVSNQECNEGDAG